MEIVYICKDKRWHELTDEQKTQFREQHPQSFTNGDNWTSNYIFSQKLLPSTPPKVLCTFHQRR